MLIRRGIVEGKTLDRILAEYCAGSEHHKGERLLALDFIRHGYDTGLHNVVVALQQALDLTWINILAAADKHVMGAYTKGLCAAIVAPKHITRFVPAVFRQDLSGFLRNIEVSRHVGRGANPQLPFRRVSAIGSHETHLDARKRPADCEIRLRQSSTCPKSDRTRFRRAITNGQFRLREGSFDLVDQRLGDRRGTGT